MEHKLRMDIISAPQEYGKPMGKLYKTTKRKDRQCDKEPLELSNEKEIISIDVEVTKFGFRYKKTKSKFESSKGIK